MHEIRIPVRYFVEFLLKNGDIDSRFSGSDRALQGARIHRKLQREAGDAYRAEVYLSRREEYDGVAFLLEGRCDGILSEDGKVTVDEIKTVTVPLERIDEAFLSVHRAQAMCYAYLYAEEEKLSRISVRLTYFQVDAEEIRQFFFDYDFSVLREFFLSLLAQYRKWASWQQEWKSLRDASLRELVFPFSEYREGQRKMAGAVYRTIESGGRLFCMAPTGTGKTISALFPAVKAMGEGKTERIFYLTAKTPARKAAEDAAALLREKGMRLKTVTLTAKEKICFCEKCECVPEKCSYARGYYDRLREALFEILETCDALTREAVEQYAEKYRLCPFELSLDLSSWCDGIICDYNYLFDPTVYLRRFFSEPGEYTFLIDEAHNLVSRGRDMYSARLSKAEVLDLKKEFGNTAFSRTLSALNRAFLALRKEREDGFAALTELPGEFLSAVQRFNGKCGEWLDQNREHPLLDRVLSLFFETRFFARIGETYGEAYRTELFSAGRDFTVKLFCADPSSLLDEAMKRGRAAVLFSATLLPVQYYKDVLGGAESKACVLQSPFAQENFLLLVNDAISTKYADRTESREAVVETIHSFISENGGNSMVYFPSYRYLNEVYELFAERYPEEETVLQRENMTEEARAELIGKFAENGHITGFCVLGGVFSEGIDLAGSRLTGSIIVGVGLPQVNGEQELLRSYYENENGMGFDFAYRFPGMNKVLQAAGRVIRTQSDRGAVLLIDSRFSQKAYRELMPEHWNHVQIVRSSTALKRKLREFREKRTDS